MQMRSILINIALLVALSLFCCSNAKEFDPTKDMVIIGEESEPLLFARNITDIYKGTWFLSNNTRSEVLGTEHRGGHTLFTLFNTELVDGVDLVKGDMVIRDGIYSSESSLKYLLCGVYYWKSGSIYMIARPSSGSFGVLEDDLSNITEIFKGVGTNITLEQAFETSERSMLVDVDKSNARTCPLRIHIQLDPLPVLLEENDADDENQGEKKQELNMKGYFISAYCHVTIKVDATTIALSSYISKWINYVVMVSLTSFIQILVLTRQIEYSSSLAGASKVSLLTVGAQAIMDSYLCLIHLTAGIVIDSMFNAFATAAFFQFVTFSVFEMRYLLIILKARRPVSFSEDWTALRREFSLFYLRFYTFLVGGFVLLYYMNNLFYMFLIIMYSFWVPQIISNAVRGTRKPLLWQYVLGISITRLAIPLYFYGCPYNFIPSQPNYPMAFFLVFWMSFQVFVLHLQDLFGPQFFVPKSFLPPKYDYHRPIPSHIPADLRNCVICMCDIDQNSRSRDWMITPCNHVFHASCLQQWLELKMECAHCRTPVPPP
eukprot:TRINITY_DN3734_c0_g3_i1.p1 TRINITY_DN3734_c0_g3~~TRINITY_DN3734_c0_g3_i1.p1  ORF type:complete len:545 (+),score=49.15 TRINITY_DN3734_c0_g3_i1:304-1938(+)